MAPMRGTIEINHLDFMPINAPSLIEMVEGSRPCKDECQ